MQPKLVYNALTNKSVLVPDKLTLEVNGVANLHAILMLNEDSIPFEVQERIKAELDTLERYMIEFKKAATEGRKNAYWHEVVADKKAFPNNREQ